MSDLHSILNNIETTFPSHDVKREDINYDNQMDDFQILNDDYPSSSQSHNHNDMDSGNSGQAVTYLNANIRIPVFYNNRTVNPGSISFGQFVIQNTASNEPPSYVPSVDNEISMPHHQTTSRINDDVMGKIGDSSFSNALLDSLNRCVRNSRINLVEVGQIILDANLHGISSAKAIEDFIQTNTWKVSGTIFHPKYLDSKFLHPMQIGQFIMTEITSRKVDSYRKLGPNRQSGQISMDMGNIVGSVLNIRRTYEVPADPPFKHYIIDVSKMEQPRKCLKQHIVLRDYIYAILTTICEPAEVIKNYTYRNVPKGAGGSENGSEEEMEEDSDDGEEGGEELNFEGRSGTFKDLPEHLVKILKVVFLAYFGLDSPLLSSGFKNSDLENDREFLALGLDFEERMANLKEKKRVWNNFTVMVFPSMLKNALCEIRLSSIQLINGKNVWVKRKRKAGFRQQFIQQQQALKRKGAQATPASTKKSKTAKK